MTKIIVTGGAGYIGSHTIIDLIGHGYDVVSIDNYARSDSRAFERIKAITGKDVKNYIVDLCNLEETRKVFELEKDASGVIHFAAFKSVGESVECPLMYYSNNMLSLINVMKCIQEWSIPHFVFSSSCSVYGNIAALPVTESTPLSPPECPYAATKQMGEKMISDISQTVRTSSILLRYFNPVGAHPSGNIGEVPYDKPNNLIPIITRTAIGLQPLMFVWGTDYPTRDGSCIRDYVHVMDIASAHTLALDYLMNHKNRSTCEIFNVGSGQGISVLEAIASFEKVSGVKLRVEIGPRRAGDVGAIYANNQLISERLGWSARYSLDDMMTSAWKWQQVLVNT